ncbi:unnamed protein product [Psylliodes chrysocephalus]|uniref:SWIM-type domain-containing protein n=1 Tax=Psylliodes chrysocephalus TaxID=3402493 RepID=A0A9P0CSY3_9CUCU|nr:unnamed protein product [Psylliodes chrysocephala]
MLNQYSVLSSSSSIEHYVDMQSFTCSCPEGYTGKICKHQSEEVNTSALINEWKLFATKFTSDIEQNLRDDPENFQEEVKVFMNSYNTNVRSSSSLLSGLHTAFKFRGTSTKRLINASRKGMKISVQSTTIMRRKTKFTGRRRFKSGRKPENGTQKQRLAPHDLPR